MNAKQFLESNAQASDLVLRGDCALADPARGVIGIVGIGRFLGDVAARAESMFRHIDYVTALDGPEHVGLGTEYVKHVPLVCKATCAQKDTAQCDRTGTHLYDGGCFEPEQLAEPVEINLAHNYSTDSAKGKLRANLQRVFATAEATH